MIEMAAEELMIDQEARNGSRFIRRTKISFMQNAGELRRVTAVIVGIRWIFHVVVMMCLPRDLFLSSGGTAINERQSENAQNGSPANRIQHVIVCHGFSPFET
jgi:hypothetical protein